MGDYIRFPTGQEALANVRRFNSKAGLLNIVALVDGTHFELIKPRVNGDDFY